MYKCALVVYGASAREKEKREVAFLGDEPLGGYRGA